MENAVFYARIGYLGQEFYKLVIPSLQDIRKEDVQVTGNVIPAPDDVYLAELTGRKEDPVNCVWMEDGFAHIELKPVSYRCLDFAVTIGRTVYTPGNVAQIKTEWADDFESKYENGVRYRLYAPKSNGQRPLILFLHGGGSRGDDNNLQLYGCFGAAKLAEDHPECYVMAPQTPGEALTVKNMDRMPKQDFVGSGEMDKGWTREYLAKICDLIWDMIRAGKVNPNRVYVTGLSMGGAGTIRAMSVGADLFAAAVSICPSMTPETYQLLCGLTHSKIWVACSYLDHTPYRHKYIVDGIMELYRAGNLDARLTMFSPEELAKYHIGIAPGITLEQRAAANHRCWVPVYHDEHGILSWLMSQSK